MSKTYRKLTLDQYFELQTQYDNIADPSESEYQSGGHDILISILNKLGFNPLGREEAVKIAGNLLSQGWTNNN